MEIDLSGLTISATKPRGKPARMLADMGIGILPVEDDEGKVDRYIISKRVAVERRTGAGLLLGIQDKTLFTSAIYLREHFAVPIVVVEGDVNYEYSAFSPQAIRGALSSMMIQYGVSVFSTPTVEETVSFIAMAARQQQIGIPDISLIPKRKATGLADMQRRVVEMLPGCGMVMARQLLQYFGSIERIVRATEDELRALSGLGARKAREIVRVVTAEYESVDTEKDLEDALEAEPGLLFKQPVQLLARQHYIFTEQKDRHIVDMVFLDRGAHELILVELKRQAIGKEHYQQIRRYLDNAHKSKLLRRLIEQGAGVRGVLASVEESSYRPEDQAVTVRMVDRKKVIAVLKRLRSERALGKGLKPLG